MPPDDIAPTPDLPRAPSDEADARRLRRAVVRLAVVIVVLLLLAGIPLLAANIAGGN